MRIKIVFWKFCKFSFVSDLEHEIFGFVATEFSLGLSKCILLGYMNSLWDVGNRSDITWRESLFEPWQKNFDLFVKTALYVSKGTIWVKKQLLKVLIFFKLFRILNEHSPCLAKIFSAGISKLKIAVFVSKDQSKNQTSENSLFFPILQKFERRITVLGKKGFGRDIKIENCSLRLKRSVKKPNFWKFSFFPNSSEPWTNNYRAWRKSSGQGYQNWKLYSMSSEYHFEVKKSFESFVSFQLFRTWSKKFLDLWQQSFRPGCQKNFLGVYMSSIRDVGIRSDITWRETFFEHWRKNFDLFLKTAFCVSKGTFWVKKVFFWKFCFFQTLRNFERNFTVLGEKVSGREIKIEKCSFRLIRSIKKSDFWKFSFFSNSSELRTNNYRARRKTFRQGYQNWKLQSSSQKSFKKPNFWKFAFFQFLQNFERTFTVLGGKLFGRDIEIENCSLRLKRSIKKPNFWKFSFFPTLQNFERTFTVLREKRFGRDIKIEIWNLRLIRSNNKSNFWKISFFFQSVQNFERRFTVLGEKVLGRGIKLENCTLCLQSINLRIKKVFWKFCKFSFVSDLEHEIFGFVATEFSLGLSKCILLGYMNSLWDVGNRSDITWRESLFEPWQKNFDLFVKTAVYVSKGTIWVKKQLLKVLIFFKLFRILNEHSPCLAKIFSAGISKLKIAVFVSKDQSKNQTSESSLFFPNSSEFWTKNYRAWQKRFRQGYQNWKLQSSSHKIKQKIIFEKSLFFSKPSELWTNNYRAWRKSSGQEYQIWKLYSMSSEYHFEVKKNFWKFSKFSFFSDLEHNCFGLEARVFTRFVKNAIYVSIWILFEVLV